jgi:hypothetical protein
MDSLSKSIAAEAWEEERGAIETAERAALAQLEIQKKTLEDQRDAAIQIAEDALGASSKKILSAADVTYEGIRRLFERGLEIPFTFRGPAGMAAGGFQAGGGDYVVNRPTWFVAGDAGPERATFTPVSSARTQPAAGRDIYITCVMPSGAVLFKTIVAEAALQ